MKKLICLILTFIMIMPSAFAAETEEYKTVLATVKDRLDIQDIYDNFDSRTSSYNGQTTYYFNWSTDDGVYLSVGATADCVITEYNISNNNKPYVKENSFKKYELEQYKAEAEKYIKMLNPDLAQYIVIADNDRYSMWSERTGFSLEFRYDGIMVDNMGGSISVNSDDLSLMSFYFNNYAKAAYPDKSTFISKESAIEAYGKNYGLELVYLLEYNDNQTKAVPVYQPVSQYNEYINAVTGEKYKYELLYATPNMEASKDEVMSGGSGGFSEIELEEINKIKGLKTIDEIEKSLKSSKILNIPATAVVSNYNLNKIKDGEYMYDMSFMENDVYIAYANVNAVSGEILSFRKHNSKVSEKELPADTLKKNATDYAKALAGAKFEKYKDNAEFDTASLTLNRAENGAKVVNDTIRVNVDKADGGLLYYNISYTDTSFPSLNGVVSKEAALKALFDNVVYDVKYMLVPEKNKLPENAVAVYSFDFSQNLQVDPYSGQVKKNHNENAKIQYNDIGGHYAEKQILKLAQYNIGFNADSFFPDNAITQKEMLTLLTQAFASMSVYRNTNYEDVFNEAVRLGLITKEQRNDEALVSRIDAAVFIAKAISADKYASIEGIWSCKFKDVTQREGYVCLLSGLGIINGDENNNFNPNNNLSKADCAILIYNCLSN